MIAALGAVLVAIVAGRDPTVGARVLVLGAADTSREPDEDALETLVGVDAHAAWEASPTLTLELDARVRHHLGLTPHDARGGYESEVRTARLAWQASDALGIEVGWIADARWPVLVDPQPVDLALGPLPASGEAGDRRRPIPLVRATLQGGDWRAEALWQPLFVAPRVPLRRSDWAPLADVPASAPGEVGDLAHPSGLAGGVAGLRATWRPPPSGGAWEAGLSWLWRWDPTPRPDGFTRQHVVGFDLATTTGLLHWRLEAAAEDAHVAYARDLRVTRDPALGLRLAASAAPFVFLDGELSLRALHLTTDDGARRIGAGPDDLDVGLRLGLLMAFDGVVRLDVEGRLALLRADGDLALALAVRLGARVEAALGLTVFGGKAMDAGIGALYDADDQLWARVVVSLGR